MQNFLRMVSFAMVMMCGVAMAAGAAAVRPVKVFVLAGDENCLEQAAISGRADGQDVSFYRTEKPANEEQAKRVEYAIYKGVYAAGTDYDKLTPEATGLVDLGELKNLKKKAKAAPALFPALALQEGYTTVLHGFLAVPGGGRHEVLPGTAESSFNITTLEGQEVYRREVGQTNPTVTAVELLPRKRYAFRTIFLQKPGVALRVAQINRPGALETVMAQTNQYACLKDANGGWRKRDDVILYDAHPIFNNTRAPGRPLQIPDTITDGQLGLGPELMLGQVLGDHFEEPVFLLRFATRHYIGFLRGSRSLGHDYQPPSSGGDPDLKGSWDVIHFNWGVWDAMYQEASSKYYQGHGNTTAVADYEKNLRTLVARMKQTGATLIWASVTPVWKGEPDKPNGDVVAFNRVATQVMKENGVIIDDLNALIPEGTGSWVSHNVHDVGNLAPHVTETIRAALASRKESTRPLPRVLMIGDSITGGYLEKVTKNFDGKAVIYKNSGNGESTWTGVRKIDEWLDLRQYLQNGQEYLELVNGVKDSLAQFSRFCPGYQNQGFELSGLVWMQGIADNDSQACAAAYEKNLACLIRDLRKDLGAPKLPVVVAALKMGDGKVYDAQKAIGDPAKYPEFAGNVKVVDTQPFYHGGDPRTLGNNAGTVLETGAAVGRAMLELQPAASTK